MGFGGSPPNVPAPVAPPPAAAPPTLANPGAALTASNAKAKAIMGAAADGTLGTTSAQGVLEKPTTANATLLGG